MASSSSSSFSLSLTSPSLSGIWEYDVFPSFHGPDVRKSFLSHVLKEFKRKAINLFIDNDIKRGEVIGPELKRAIRGSKISVVLLSKNYASSSWCLEELVEIMRKESGQIVFTIFYKVNPTDVRKQTGHFGEVFKRTCEGKDNEKIETWSEALEDVANIAGYHSIAWDNEASMIEKIAVDISDRLNDFTPSREFENCIGLENHMAKLIMLLCLDSNEVIKIGIWGPSGIGKSAIVRYLFSKLSGGFPNSALIENIKRRYSYPTLCFDKRKAMIQLLEDTLSKLLNQSNVVVGHLGVAQQRLRNNRVFLVLDDVDRLEQIDALAVNDFGPGSRIIITTQDRRLLKAIEVNHIYEVDFPSSEEALQMFCMYAFQKKTPEDGFDELAREITRCVGELPLGLEVMGSYFRGLCKDKEQWSMEVSRLRNNLNGDIERVLKFSYDALYDEDKDLFLYIACFFNKEDVSHVEKYLTPTFEDLRQRLDGLEEKSLISLCDDLDLQKPSYRIEMHELLVQLGQKIARGELGCESKDQFLNDYKDAYKTITGKKMTMKKKKDGNFYEGKLRVAYDSSGHPIIIRWGEFPFTCLDFTNILEFLVELYLFQNKLEKLWYGTKLLPNLKILCLSDSNNLKELPNLSMATNLEKLFLERCYSLVSLPQLPESLSYLNATDCKSLEKLDCSFGNAVNELIFVNCFNLNKKARDLIIRTSTKALPSRVEKTFFPWMFEDNAGPISTYGGVVLPGKEVPTFFTYKASGSSVKVKLNQKHLPISTKFKACILLVYKGGENESCLQWSEYLRVSCSITSKQQNATTPYSKEVLDISTEHLYIFDIEAKEVTSTELDFAFSVETYDARTRDFGWDWEIKKCGVLSEEISDYSLLLEPSQTSNG